MQASGTFTFLFTDVEDSCRVCPRDPRAVGAATARHDEMIEQRVAQHGGPGLTKLGFVALRQGDLEAERMPRSVGARLEYDRTLGLARAGLAESVVAAELASGRELSLDQAIAEGLETRRRTMASKCS